MSPRPSPAGGVAEALRSCPLPERASSQATRVNFVPFAQEDTSRSPNVRGDPGGADCRCREIRAAMSFLAAIIVEGVPAQLPAARTWRVQMRDQRRRRVGTGPHGQRRRRAHVATFRFGRFSPRAPAPAAPPLPAQPATHRSKPDGSARKSRRSIFPSTCRLR